jgi:hypothetical protein
MVSFLKKKSDALRAWCHTLSLYRNDGPKACWLSISRWCLHASETGEITPMHCISDVQSHLPPHVNAWFIKVIPYWPKADKNIQCVTSIAHVITISNKHMSRFLSHRRKLGFSLIRHSKHALSLFTIGFRFFIPMPILLQTWLNIMTRNFNLLFFSW